MLAINFNFETMNASKQSHSSSYSSIIGCRKVIVAEKYPTGPQNTVGPVYVGPGRVKIMTRIHFDQIPEYAPFAQLRKHRPGRKRDG